jgi:predicted nucleotidyltransferase
MKKQKEVTLQEMMSQREHRTRKLYGYIFNERMVLEGYRGSIAHNLHVPREADDVYGIDDIDYFGLYVFPKEYYYSLEGYYHSKEVVDQKIEENDTVKYAIHKAFHLLQACNPNIISFLYNRPEHLTTVSKGGELILKNRDMFLSRRRIRDGFAGYAHAQLTKLTNGAYKGYMGERRKNVVDKHGYDTKNAATLIRLLRQGIEALKTGEIQTYRTHDRDFLLSIKTGKFTLSEVQDMADQELKQLDEAFEVSKIPLENSKTKINELLVEIMETELR